MSIATQTRLQSEQEKKKTKWYRLMCVKCRQETTEQQTTSRCLECDGALEVEYSDSDLRSRVDVALFQKPSWSVLDYRALYPFNGTVDYVTLNEGHTPLARLEHLGKEFNIPNLYVKNEAANPTGVFKDRGSVIEVTKAKELGAKAICCASTGNMAGSVSAYAAVAGFPCYVFVPEGTPIGKLSQSLAYGAHVITIRGSYADCVAMCDAAAKSQGFYVAGDYAFRGEGHKTIAYEIYQQLHGTVPDAVIVPMGCGTNIAAIYKGWKDLLRLGVVQKMPRMIGVQPDTVPTIVSAWQEKQHVGNHMTQVKSVASAVGIGTPLDDVKALAALYESNGYAVSVAEKKIIPTQYQLSHTEGYFVEPSSALGIAALPKLIASSAIKPDDVVVVVLTGSGLKDPQSIMSLIPKPHVLEPSALEVSRYFDLQMYNVKSSSDTKKEQVLWTEVPDQATVRSLVEKEFNISLQDGYVAEVMRQVVLFHEKIDKMQLADLQGIVETVLQNYYGTQPVLQVLDFEVHTQQHKKPLAWVKINFAGKELEEHAVGVGPVDAIIQALQKLLRGRDHLQAELTHYNVEINTGGTDAVVRVQLTLRDMNQTEVTGTSTSPDVIVASIQAFESAYNILAYKASLRS